MYTSSKKVIAKVKLGYIMYLGAKNSLFVPQFLGDEKLGRQCV